MTETISQAEPPVKAVPERCHSVGTFADSLYEPDDLIEVRRLPSGRSTWHRASELPNVANDLRRDNAKGQGVFIGANPRTREGGRKAADVQLARSIFADFDHTDLDDAAERWERIGLDDPTLAVASGHGCHAYWRLEEPMDDLGVWTERQRQLASALRSDPAVCDPPRVMRCPGFTNWKPPARECRIVAVNPACRVASPEPKGATEANEQTTRGAAISAVHAVLAVKQTPVAIANAIEVTQPNGPGRRRRAIFELARHLRAVAELDGVPLGALRPIVAEWHRRALPTIRTKPLDETWSDFVAAWPLVRFPFGADPIAEVVGAALAAPDPAEAMLYDTREARLLVRACRELQRRAGDKPFFLSCRQAGTIAGTSHVVGAAFLKMLVADGVLSIAKGHTASRARRYRYVVGMVSA